MGSVVKSVGSILGGGSSDQVKASSVSSAPFNLDKEAAPRATIADQQRDLAIQRSAQAQQQQQQLITQLQGAAAGTAPSLAQAQLKDASSRSLAQQLAAAAAQRGGSVAGQQRQLMMNQGMAGRDLAAQSAQARIQETQGAQQQLGSMLMQNQGAADALTSNYLQQGFDFATATKKAQQQKALADAGFQQQASTANAQNNSALTGALLGAGATAGAAALKSDERAKQDIKPAGKDMSKFLEALSAKSYKYKDAKQPGAAAGQRYGITAQDLEKSPVGKSLVKNTPTGKMVDTVQGFGAVLAAQAEMHKRMKQMEVKLGSNSDESDEA